MAKKRRRHVESGEIARRGGRRVILPGEARAGATELAVPAGLADTVVVGVCHACGARFGPGQEEEWQRHLRPCYMRHEGEIRGARQASRSQLEIFSEEAWDPELAAYFRKVGDRMLREGRLEMRPHERADG